MIIADSDDSSADEGTGVDTGAASRSRSGRTAGANGEMDVAGTAYIESMVSTDGFTRGPGGRVKFNKDTKKRRRAEAEFEDGMEVDEVPPGQKHQQATPPSSKKLKVKEKKLGHEFKAKVSSGQIPLGER